MIRKLFTSSTRTFTTSTTLAAKKAIVVGGCGGLGTACVEQFKQQGWSVLCVDFASHPEVDNVQLDADADWTEQVALARQGCADAGFDSAEAVLHVAGSWAGSSVESDDFAASLEHLWSANVRSAALSAHLAGRCLGKGGMLTLTGAAAAQDGPTSFMTAYGMTKAATHHLVSSIAESGLPEGCAVNAILPVTIDTPTNRNAMPDADTSTWTPAEEIAQELCLWAENDKERRPANGAMVRVETVGNKTAWNWFN
jgi:dihydropteridine reductase